MSERDFDLAAERSEQERDAGIADARIALSQPGSANCHNCGEPISEGRRRAVPSARRCIKCQTILENEKHRR